MLASCCFFSNLSCFRNTTNSHLSISTKPGKNYLTIQELARGFLFPLQGAIYRLLFSLSPIKLSCFQNTTNSHLSITIRLGEIFQVRQADGY